jgi:hypothetical protein
MGAWESARAGKTSAQSASAERKVVGEVDLDLDLDLEDVNTAGAALTS